MSANGLARAQNAASEPSAPLWGAHADIVGRTAQEHSAAGVEFFVPMLQDQDSLIFIDAGINGDFHSEVYGTFGVGYRQIINPGLILGGIVAVDVTRTDDENTFGAISLGAEAIGTAAEARINVQLPFSGASQISDETVAISQPGTLTLLGNQLVEQAASRRITVDEVPLTGVEGEVGVNLPIGFDRFDDQLKAFAGAYHYDGDGVDSFTGVSGRLEYSVRDVMGDSLPGAELILSAGLTHDEEYGTNFAGEARLRIPLGVPARADSGARALSPIEERMTQRVVRTTRIHTSERTRSETSGFAPRVVTDPLTGLPLDAIFFADGADTAGAGTLADPTTLSDAVRRAGVNGTIVAEGNAGTINTPGVTLADGQRLVGGGVVIPVRLADGTIASFRLGQTAPVIAGVPTANVITLGAGNRLQALTITGGLGGIAGRNVGALSLRQITIAGSGAAGLSIVNTAGTSTVGIDGLSVSSAGGPGIAVNGLGGGTTTVTGFSGVGVASAGGGGVLFDGVTFDANPGAAGFQRVAAGDLTVGDQANPAAIAGDGLRLNQVAGDLDFDSLLIANENGAGLFIRDRGGAGGDFSFGNDGGAITTVNGAAIDIDPVSLASRFGTVSSTNADGQGSGGDNGIFLDNILARDTGSPALVIDTVEIDAATGDGLVATNNTGNLVFGTTTIADVGGTGIVLADNTGSVTFGSTAITDPGVGGIDIAGRNGRVSFGDVDITGLGAGTGLDLTDQAGLASTRVALAFETLDITGTGAAGSVGIDYSGTTNPFDVKTADSSTISDVAIGIDLRDAAASGLFQYGDGSATDADGRASLIDADRPLEIAGLDGTTGLYNLRDVAFVGDISDLTGITVFYVDADGGNDSGLADGSAEDPGTLAQAIASGADVIALVDNQAGGQDVIDAGAAIQGAPGSLTLADGQRVVSFLTEDMVDTGGGGGTPSNLLLTGIDANIVRNPNSGSGAPRLTTTEGGSNTLVLDSSNTLIGTVIDNGAGAIAVFGNGIGGLTVRDSEITSISLNAASGTGLLETVAIGQLALDGGTVALVGTKVEIGYAGAGAALSVGGGHSGSIAFDAASTIAATSGLGLRFDETSGDYAFDGATTLGGGASIAIFDLAGSLSLGDVTITDPTGNGIDIAGTNGAISFGNVTITGVAAGATALDFNGAALAGAFTARSLVATGAGGTPPAGSIGIDLRGVSGGQAIRVGDSADPATDTPSRLANFATGVFVDAGSNAQFTFGDGEDTVDQDSRITATVRIDAASAPTLGSYNFLDVDFEGASPGAGFVPATVYYFSETGTGTGATQLDPGSIGGAEASGADLLIPIGPDAIDAANGGGGGSLDLIAAQQLRGFATAGGTLNVGFTGPSTIQISANSSTITDLTGDGTPTLTTSAVQSVVNLSDGNTLSFISITGGTAGIAGSAFNNLVANNITITDTSGAGISLTGTTGNITFGGTTSVTATGGTGVSIAATSGTISFATLAVDNTATLGGGVEISGNGSFGFTGGLDITTDTGTGFTATGGATVTIAATAGAETVTTATGPILAWNGVTIGAGGVSFDSLTATGTVTGDAINLTDVDGGAFSGGTVGILGTTGLGADGIQIVDSAASFNFGAVTIDNALARGIALTGANGDITFASIAITDGAGRGVEIFGATNDITFNGGSIGPAVTIGTPERFIVFNQAATSTISLSNVDLTGDASSADLFNVQNSAGTITVTGGTFSQASSFNAVGISGGSATITIGAEIVHTGTGNAVVVDGTSGVTVFDGAVSNSGGGRAFDIGSATAIAGGSISFDGAVTDTGSSGVRVQNLAAGAAVAVNAALTVTGAVDDALSFTNNEGSLSFADVTAGAAGTARAIAISDASGSATYEFDGQVTLDQTGSTGDAVSITGPATHAVSFLGGLSIEAEAGAGFTASGAATIEIAAAGIRQISTDTGQILSLNGVEIGSGDVAFTSLTSTGIVTGDAIDMTGVGGGSFSGGIVSITGTAAGFDGIAITGSDAAVGFGTTTIGATGGDGIALAGNSGNLAFGATTITSPTVNGIDISGSNGAIGFGDLEINGIAAGGVALDFNGATLSGAFTAESLVATGAGGTPPAGSIGIDLRGITGGQTIDIGVSPAPDPDTDTPSSLSNFATGVFVDSASDAAFTFGDGEDTVDQASRISATTRINAASAPTLGSYNFLDVDFQGASPGAGFVPATVYYFSETGTGTGSTQFDPGSIGGAEASGADLLVPIGPDTIDAANGGGLGSLDLIDAQQLRGFETAGGTLGVNFAGPSTILLSAISSTITDLNNDGSPTLTTATAGQNVVNLADGNGLSFISTIGGVSGIAGTGINNLTARDIRVSDSLGDGVAFSGVTGQVILGGTNTITGSDGDGLSITASPAEFMINNVTVAESGAHGINLVGANGDIGILDAIVDDSVGAGIRVSGATNVVVISGVVGGTTVNGGAGILVEDSVAGSVVSFVLMDVTANGADAYNFADNDGDLSVSGGNVTQIGTGDGVDISGGTGTVCFGSDIDHSGAGGAAVRISGTAGLVDICGDSIAKTGGGVLVDIADASGGVEFGSIAFPLTLTASGGAGGIAIDNSSVTFRGPVTLSTGTADAVSLTNTAGHTIAFLDGLAITTTSGAGFTASGGGTVRVAATAGAETITTTTGQAISLNGVSIGVGGFNFDSVNADGAAIGIGLNDVGSIAGGAIDLGAVTLEGITSTGVAISGTLDAGLNFSSLAIELAGGTGTAFDLSGATLGAGITANDFDVTNAGARGTTVGIDLTGVGGNQTVRLGDTDPDGESSTIAGVETGVVVTNSSSVQFTYGDGESATDRDSTIDATVRIAAPGSVAAGASFNFQDLALDEGGPGTGFGIGRIIYVDSDGATGGGDGSGSDGANPATLAYAEANAGIGGIIVLVNNGTAISAFATGVDDTLQLLVDQQVLGFADGSVTIDFDAPIGFDFGTDSFSLSDPAAGGGGGAGGAATLTSSAGADVITLGASGNRIDGFILDGNSGSTARGITSAGSSGTTISNMTVRDFGVAGVNLPTSPDTTLSDISFIGNAVDLVIGGADATLTDITSSGATGVGGAAMQFLDATGTTTLDNVSISGAAGGAMRFEDALGSVDAFDVDLAGASALAIVGGTADFSFDADSSISNTAGLAVSLSGTGGDFTHEGSVTSLGATAGGIAIAGATSANTVSFDGTVRIGNTTTRAVSGVSIDNNGTASVVSFADLAVATNAATAFAASDGGTVNVTTGSLSALGATAISLDSLAAGIDFASTSSSGGVNNVSLTNVTGSVALGTGALSGATGTAFAITGGTVDVSYAGSVTKTLSGRILDFDNTAATVTFSGDFDASTASGGMRFQNVSGSATFSGTVTLSTGAADGVAIVSNSGAIAFNGGLVITTTSGTGFAATGTGSVDVANTATESITTATGRILALNGVSIASGMRFDSLTATGTVTGDAINVTNVTGGSFSGGPVSIAGTTGGAGSDGIEINNSSAVFDFGLAAVTISNTTGNGINLVGANGTITIFNTAVNGATGAGVRVSGSTGFVFLGGAIGGTTVNGGPGLLVEDTVSGTVQTTGISVRANGADAVQLSNNAGAVEMDFPGTITQLGAGDGVDISGGTGDVQIDSSIVHSGAAGAAVRIAGTAASITLDGDDITKTVGGVTADISDATGTVQIGDIFAAGSVSASAGAGGILIDNSNVAFGTQVSLSTGTADAVTITNNAGRTVAFTRGLAITTTSGAGFTADSGTVRIAASSGTESITTGTGRILGLSDVILGTGGVNFESLTSTGILGVNAVSLTNVSGGSFSGGTVSVASTTGSAITVAGSSSSIGFGTTTIGQTGGDGIALTGNSGSVGFTGITTVNNPGLVGVDIEGTNGAISFADLKINLNTAGTTGLDLSGAVVNGNITATDFDVAGTTVNTTLGVNLANTTRTGAQTVRLGDTTVNGGQSSSIVGTGRGVLFSQTTDIRFVFGDGEGVVDTGSLIDVAGRAIDSTGALLPASGVYNFADVEFGSSVIDNLASISVYYVDQANDAGAGTLLDPGSIAGFEASTTANVLVLIDNDDDDASDLIDMGTGSLDLENGRVAVSFALNDAAIDVSTLGVGGSGAPSSFTFTGIANSPIIQAPGGIDSERPTLTTGGTANTINLPTTGTGTITAGVGRVIVRNSGTGDGIAANATAGSVFAFLGNDIGVTGGQALRLSTTAGTADMLRAFVDNNRFERTTAGAAVSFNGQSISALANSIAVRSFGSNTVTGNGTGGGILFDNVRFDADGAGAPVDAATLTVGTTAARVQGNGVTFLNPIGTFDAGTLNIANNNGTGLLVDTKTAGTDFTLTNTGGALNTTNGAAFNLDPLTVDMTFGSVNSFNSGTSGIIFDEVAGSFTVTGATSISNSTGFAIAAINTNTGTFNFNTISVTNGASAGGGISVASGTLNVGGAASITTGSGTGAATSGGALNFAGGVAINANTGVGLSGTGGTLQVAATSGTESVTSGTNLAISLSGVTIGAAGLNFDSTSRTSASPTPGVSFTNVTGSIILGAGSLVGGNAPAFFVSGGTANVTYGGSITQANNAALLSVAGGHTGTITFNTGTMSATNGTGLQFDNADGTYNFNGTTTLNGGDAGVDILNGSAGTFTFGTSTAITHGAVGPAFFLDSSNANVTYSGGITDNNGYAVAINNHDGGTITFQTGTISSTGAGAGGIIVQNSNGGIVNFNGQTTLSTGTVTAVDLNANTGGVVNFDSTGAAGGSLNIITSSGIGFNATGGGTVTVQGAGNTIISGTGPALNVANTTIGAAGLTFEAIFASGGVNGIVLNNTGTLGGLTVTGTGSANSGGVIQNTTGSGIVLTNTRNVSLTSMSVSGADLHGLQGSSVTNLDIANSSFTNNGDAINEHGIFIQNLLGTASAGLGSSITNTTVSGSNTSNLVIRNDNATATGNLANPDLLVISGSTFQNLAAPNGTAGMLINSRGDGPADANLRVEVSNSTFSANRSTGLLATSDGGDLQLQAVGNQFNQTGGNQLNGIEMLMTQDRTLTYDLRGNSIVTGTGGVPYGILVQNSGTGTMSGTIGGLAAGAGNAISPSGNVSNVAVRALVEGNGSIVSSIQGNTIVAGGTSGGGVGIQLRSRLGSGTITARVEQNTISLLPGSIDVQGIDVLTDQGTNRIDATIRFNNINLANGTGLANGIVVKAGDFAADTTSVCLNLAGNTVTNAGTIQRTGDRAYILYQGTGTTFQLQGLTPPAGASEAQIEAFIESQNLGISHVVTASDGFPTTLSYTNGTCTVP